MSEPTDDEIRARAQAALDEADDTISGARHRVRAARSFAMYQVLVRTVFERRSVTWRHQPARTDAATVAPRVAPDPWSIELSAPSDGRTAVDQHAIAAHEVLSTCPTCGGSLRSECMFCKGSGWIHTQTSSPDRVGTMTVRTRCASCDGAGRAACRTCDAMGRVFSTPVVVIETGTVTHTRPVDDGSLPTDLVVAVAGVELKGRVAFAERGAAIEPRGVSTGAPFRGPGPRVSPPIDAAIDALLSEDPVGGDWRVRDRVIEVTEVPLFEAHLDNGQTAYVCGAPARVLPEGVLAKHGGVLDAVRGLFARKPNADE